VYAYNETHTYIYVHTKTHTYIYVHTQTQSNLHAHVCNIYTNVCANTLCANTQQSACKLTAVCITCIYIWYIQICIYVYIHAYMCMCFFCDEGFNTEQSARTCIYIWYIQVCIYVYTHGYICVCVSFVTRAAAAKLNSKHLNLCVYDIHTYMYIRQHSVVYVGIYIWYTINLFMYTHMYICMFVACVCRAGPQQSLCCVYLSDSSIFIHLSTV